MCLTYKLIERAFNLPLIGVTLNLRRWSSRDSLVQAVIGRAVRRVPSVPAELQTALIIESQLNALHHAPLYRSLVSTEVVIAQPVPALRVMRSTANEQPMQRLKPLVPDVTDLNAPQPHWVQPWRRELTRPFSNEGTHRELNVDETLDLGSAILQGHVPNRSTGENNKRSVLELYDTFVLDSGVAPH